MEKTKGSKKRQRSREREKRMPISGLLNTAKTPKSDKMNSTSRKIALRNRYERGKIFCMKNCLTEGKLIPR